MNRILAVSIGLGLIASTARAQQSASFRQEEHVLHAGGNPANGVVLSSAGFRIRLDSIAGSLASPVLAGATFRLEGGFVAGYPPPREVQGLTLGADKKTIAWAPDPSAGTYDLYRDSIGALPALGYGACFAQGIKTATTFDASFPAPGGGFFYLVTAENRLGEEGGKGFGSLGERKGTVCP